MLGIPLRVPFLLVMLVASLWIFALARWKPELLEQKPTSRFYVSLLESLVCGFLWGTVLIGLFNDPIEGLIFNSCITAFFWFCIVFYSRLHYSQALQRASATEHTPKGYYE